MKTQDIADEAYEKWCKTKRAKLDWKLARQLQKLVPDIAFDFLFSCASNWLNEWDYFHSLPKVTQYKIENFVHDHIYSGLS